jgi:hypothetical protein
VKSSLDAILSKPLEIFATMVSSSSYRANIRVPFSRANI